jgi:hypothetical protein
MGENMLRQNYNFLLYSLLVLFLLAGSFLLGLSHKENDIASAQAEVSSELPITADASRFFCQVDSVAVYEDRIHIRCNPGDGDINFFAHATDSVNAQNADRMLVLANTAYALGKSVYADYIDDPAQNPSGCQVSNCRQLIAITLSP